MYESFVGQGLKIWLKFYWMKKKYTRSARKVKHKELNKSMFLHYIL